MINYIHYGGHMKRYMIIITYEDNHTQAVDLHETRITTAILTTLENYRRDDHGPIVDLHAYLITKGGE